MITSILPTARGFDKPSMKSRKILTIDANERRERSQGNLCTRNGIHYDHSGYGSLTSADTRHQGMHDKMEIQSTEAAVTTGLARPTKKSNLPMRPSRPVVHDQREIQSSDATFTTRPARRRRNQNFRCGLHCLSCTTKWNSNLLCELFAFSATRACATQVKVRTSASYWARMLERVGCEARFVWSLSLGLAGAKPPTTTTSTQEKILVSKMP